MELVYYFFLAWLLVLIYNIVAYFYMRYREARHIRREAQIFEDHLMEVKREMVAHVMKQLTSKNSNRNQSNRRKKHQKEHRASHK
ncbi:unnamed protein product [Auanema sp. JU1783]|nr:unnamed protein product [Auanema sp. JU1783]